MVISSSMVGGSYGPHIRLYADGSGEIIYTHLEPVEIEFDTDDEDSVD